MTFPKMCSKEYLFEMKKTNKKQSPIFQLACTLYLHWRLTTNTVLSKALISPSIEKMVEFCLIQCFSNVFYLQPLLLPPHPHTRAFIYLTNVYGRPTLAQALF